MSTPAGIPVATCDLSRFERTTHTRGRRFLRGPMVTCDNHQRGASASIMRSVTDTSAAARRALSPYSTEHGSPTGVI